MPAKKPRNAGGVLRDALSRVQRESKGLVTRLERELRRARRELSVDAKMIRREVTARVESAVRTLDSRRATVVKGLEGRIADLEGELRRRLDVPRTEDVSVAQARLRQLEERLNDIDRRLAELGDQLHDRLGAGAG